MVFVADRCVILSLDVWDRNGFVTLGWDLLHHILLVNSVASEFTHCSQFGVFVNNGV